MSINDEPPPDDREAGITRRRFVTGLGVAAGAAVAAGYGLSVWANGDSSTTAPPGSRSPRPPSAGATTARWSSSSSEAVTTGSPRSCRSPTPRTRHCGRRSGITNAIPLDDAVGLHPNLAKLAARYRAG